MFFLPGIRINITYSVHLVIKCVFFYHEINYNLSGLKCKVGPKKTKYSLFNKPFHAFIETCTLFFLSLTMHFSHWISNPELKWYSPVEDFISGLMSVYQYTLLFKMPIAYWILTPFYTFALLQKRGNCYFQLFLFSSKANRVTQTAEKLRLDLIKKLLFFSLWSTVVKFAMNS